MGILFLWTSLTEARSRLRCDSEYEWPRSFRGHFSFSRRSMLISGEKAEEVYRKIAAVQEHMRTYCLAAGSLKLSVEDLQWSVVDMYGLHIEKFEVSFDGEHLRGMVERYSGGKVIIYIRDDQSEDWKRFVSTKELCHVVIDEEEDWSSAGTKTIEDLVYEASIQSTELATPQAQSEQFAMIAALELVYPLGARLVDIERLKKKETTINKIALEHGVPQYAIGLALNKNMMEISKGCWAAIGGAASTPSTSG